MTKLTQEEREKITKIWTSSDFTVCVDELLDQIDKILEEREKKEQEELKWIKDTLDAVYEKLTSI